MDWMQWIHGTPKKDNPALSLNPGDEVRVWYRILEQGKERLGQFEGTVIRTRGAGPSKTFSVRRITFGEGVERVFPVDSKTVAKIEVLRHGHLKRARLYYLRALRGRAARLMAKARAR
jgi:large subunit ribosomal protein L19